MIRSILVPLDGSTFGEHALPLAMSMARHLDASLHLIHVHSLTDATYAELQVFDNTLDQEILNAERDYLRSMQKKVQDRLSVPVTIRNVEGDVATVIREQADSLRASWVVMTTHARGPMGRFWMGSVADDLLQTLPIPLILVHRGDEAPDLDKDVRIQHMLIPLDGTPEAEQILESAVTLGQSMHADYTLLRVMTPMYTAAVPAEPAMFGSVAGEVMTRVEQIHRELRDEATVYLNKISKDVRIRTGSEVETRVVMEEQPAEAILATATGPIDMIALETHGRGGLSRLLLGSIADSIVRGSKLPILIHKPAV